MRYHTMLTERNLLETYEQIFYVDADMLFVAPVGSITSYGVVATLHPGFVGHRGSVETRPESWAYACGNTAYYCGGFQGGETRAYLKAATEMAEGVDQDTKKGITAVWHDESHWNRYLRDYPPSKVLSPSYCYPEGYAEQYGWSSKQYPPILMALDKNKRGNHPRRP
jgi:histo-blood group ABO system transferase